MPIPKLIEPLLNGTKAQYLIGVLFTVITASIGLVYAEQTKTDSKLDNKVDNTTLVMLIEQLNTTVNLQQKQYEQHRLEQNELSRRTAEEYALAQQKLMRVETRQEVMEEQSIKQDELIIKQLADIQKELATIKRKIE